MRTDRHFSLDALRGFAVLGILLMNVIAFSMPMSAYINPAAWGGSSHADRISWAVAFIMVDGKMRGLFSIMFGASMLLILERAMRQGAAPWPLHARRMAWLFLFGIAHFILIWEGDILAHYAVCGLIAYGFHAASTKRLAAVGMALITVNLLIWTVILWTAHVMRTEAMASNLADAKEQFAIMLDALGAPGGASVAEDLQLYRGSYPDMVTARLADAVSAQITMVFGYGAETTGLMLVGMAFYKSGALTGAWSRPKILRWAVFFYLLGLPISAFLAWKIYAAGFEPLLTAALVDFGHTPARLAVTIGHLMLLLLIAKRPTPGPLLRKIAAAGRVAFSNYILTSLVMTSIFYGYGGGLFGHVTRAQAYLLTIPMIALMIAWPQPWLRGHHYGPLEWLWRSLSKGRRMALRIKPD
ncbi:MAG: DUF418 domain-containing protein [Chakrabartia sp.]